MAAFGDLPDELKLHIFSFLSTAEKGVYSTVSHEWNRLLGDCSLWNTMEHSASCSTISYASTNKERFRMLLELERPQLAKVRFREQWEKLCLWGNLLQQWEPESITHMFAWLFFGAATCSVLAASLRFEYGFSLMWMQIALPLLVFFAILCCYGFVKLAAFINSVEPFDTFYLRARYSPPFSATPLRLNKLTIIPLLIDVVWIVSLVSLSIFCALAAARLDGVQSWSWPVIWTPLWAGTAIILLTCFVAQRSRTGNVHGPIITLILALVAMAASIHTPLLCVLVDAFAWPVGLAVALVCGIVCGKAVLYLSTHPNVTLF